MIGIAHPASSPNSGADAVSFDGSVAVGGSLSGGYGQAFRWTGTTPTGLGVLPNPNNVLTSWAYGVSDNGRVIVGGSAMYNSNYQAFRWDATNGMVGIGPVPSLTLPIETLAYAASADGSVIVGERRLGFESSAFRYTASEGMQLLGDFPGSQISGSIATDVTPDGSIIVGSGRRNGSEAFRWTAATGLVSLGKLQLEGNKLSGTQAFATSADGTVIVGRANENSFQQIPQQAFVWTSAQGMRSLKSVLLNDVGLNLVGWELKDAFDISNDGLTVVGWGINPAGDTEAWVAVLPEPGGVLVGMALIATWVVRGRTLRRRWGWGTENLC